MNNEILQRKPVVLQRTGFTHSTLYYHIEQGAFPKPYKLGKRTVAWKKSEVDEWIDGLERSMEEECKTNDWIDSPKQSIDEGGNHA